MYTCRRMLGTGSLCPKQMLGLGLFKIRFESFGTSSVDYILKSTKQREGHMLKKLMVGSRKRLYDAAPKWVEKPTIGTDSFLKPKQTKNPRRVNVLNTVLMKAITDVMANGDFTEELFGLGIEISRVKVTNDFSYVNVFWSCGKSVDSDKTEVLLNNIAGPIRDTLCRTHVLGNVPCVRFVKDKIQTNINQIEHLMARADFGPDFVPHDHTHYQKSELLLSQSPPSFPDLNVPSIESSDLDTAEDHISKEQLLSKVPTCVCEPSDSNSEMRMDLLGLNHVAIMQSVVQSIHNSKAEHRKSPGLVPIPDISQTGSSSSTTTPTHVSTFNMSVRQFMEKKKREKLMLKNQEFVDLRSGADLEELDQDEMNWDELEKDIKFYEEDFFEEDFFEEDEMLNFNSEHSNESHL